MLAHLAAEQLIGVMDREEVARHFVDSAVAILTGRSHVSSMESSA